MLINIQSFFKSWFRRGLGLKPIYLYLLVGLFLLLAVMPLVMLRYQQSRILTATSESQVDSVMWMAYTFEREHARLRVSLRSAIESQVPENRQTLALRYDIFLSRYDIVKNSPTLEYFRKMTEYAVAIKAAESFIQIADPVMHEMADKAVNPELIQYLWQKAEADEVAIRELTNAAGVAVYEQIEARNTTIREQGAWLFALISLQWLIFLAVLVGAIIYIRRQRIHNLELVKLTRLLRTTSRRAEGGTKAKSVFLANMSHELRTPFQGLLGMLNLLADTPLSDLQKDYTHTALHSAKHLLGILNDILDISAIESGSVKLRTEPVHLRSLIKEAQDLMAAPAHAKNINLIVEVDDGLPQWIEADQTRFNQILFNLLSNAIKFTNNGDVSLKLAVSASSFPGAPLGMRLTVSDSGIGMDAKTLAGLFSRFHQADQSIQRRFGGTGLGLEISLNLAKLMGGNINAESTLGVGSIFNFELPLHLASAPVLPVQKIMTSQRSLRVMIVEDHPINIKYLQYLLEKMGHQTISCENGRLALECLKKTTVDVILMDMHMPVMDGINATLAIRQLGNAMASVKIIMVSADVLNDTRQVAFEAGVNDFITKPVQADGLRQALDRSLYETTANIEVGNTDQQIILASLEVINAKIYQEFLDLMPKETHKNQLDDLFGNGMQALTKISDPWRAGQWLEASEYAHQLKGVCMLMGLTAMANVLAKMEMNLKDAENDTMPAMLDQLRFEMEATRSALAKFSVPT